MPNGYKIVQDADGKWRLKCNERLLPDKYESKLEAHTAALGKAPCEGSGKPEQVLTPETRPDKPKPTEPTPSRRRITPK